MTTKYGNRPTEYLGIRFRSKLEANYAQELELRRHAFPIGLPHTPLHI